MFHSQIFKFSNFVATSKARIWLVICEFLWLLTNQNVWFVTFFALNYLKTAFILTNQNWVIFPCILLGLKSYAWFQNWTSAQREFNLKSQVWFQTKIAQHEVQLPLYYFHFEIAQIQDLVSSNILLLQYWASLKFNSSIFWEEK